MITWNRFDTDCKNEWANFTRLISLTGLLPFRSVENEWTLWTIDCNIDKTLLIWLLMVVVNGWDRTKRFRERDKWLSQHLLSKCDTSSCSCKVQRVPFCPTTYVFIWIDRNIHKILFIWLLMTTINGWIWTNRFRETYRWLTQHYLSKCDTL